MHHFPLTLYVLVYDDYLHGEDVYAFNKRGDAEEMLRRWLDDDSGMYENPRVEEYGPKNG